MPLDLPAAYKVPWEIIGYFVDSCFEDYSSLRQLALTCHGLLPRARVALFRHVRILTRSSLENFMNAIFTNTRLAGLVVQLTVIPADSDMLFPPFTSFSFALQKLRTMSLGVDPTLSTPYHASHSLRFNSVISLEISNVTFRDLNDLVKLLWTFPELRSLELGTIAFKREPTEEETAYVREHSGSRQGLLARLEVVEIKVRKGSVRPKSTQRKLMNLGQTLGLFPLELMEALGYGPGPSFLQFVRRRASRASEY